MGLEPEIGLKRPAGRARRSISSLGAGLTGSAGVNHPVTAGTAKGSGAVSGIQQAGEAAYAAGTKALATFGRSVQPSMCWQVRMKTALPATGSPYRAT